MRKHILGGYVRWYEERITYGKKYNGIYGDMESWRVFIMDIEK